MEGRGALEIYPTVSGQIAIKQEDPLGNPDAIVFLEVTDIPTFVSHLKAVAEEAQSIREEMLEKEASEEAVS